jgi:centrosomal protein CEP290
MAKLQFNKLNQIANGIFSWFYIKFHRADKEKITLQRKLKSTGMTVDQVLGVRALESEKELEELKKRNLDLENDILYMR